jgi:hypothetical protein
MGASGVLPVGGDIFGTYRGTPFGSPAPDDAVDLPPIAGLPPPEQFKSSRFAQ